MIKSKIFIFMLFLIYGLLLTILVTYREGEKPKEDILIEAFCIVDPSTTNVLGINKTIEIAKLNQLNINKINQDLIEPEIIEVEEAKEQTWTNEELEMLACTIYCEAGADYISDETRLMVGCVVMNRVEHKLYPNTIYEVLTQKSQYGRFYWTGIVWPDRASAKVEAHAVQRAYDIAERVLNGERILDRDYIFQAEFKQSNDYIYQDKLYFCR